MTFRGDHVDELISASLSGDLTDAERVELDAHLARCETCRATLAAFTAERRILGGLPISDAPRDLSARVRSGIDSGRLGAAWWRRPGGFIAIMASTVTVAVLAVLILGNLRPGPVGQASNSPIPSASGVPSASAPQSVPPSVAPTPLPAFVLARGELGYLSVNGAPLEPLRLTFVNDATGDSIDAGSVSGPTIAASISPNGQWLAYISQKGETGANEVWALHLTDGEVLKLGCSSSAPFTDRLAWSSDSGYLAYTLVGIDLGSGTGCQPPSDGSDVWLLDTSSGKQARFTTTGNAYAASFVAGDPASLAVSFGAATPWTEVMSPATGVTNERVDGVFAPLFSPDGSRAIFWSGTMTSNGGSWHFSVGGMPQLSRDFRSAGPGSPWIGTPLFTDLTPVGGEAFASGDFTWGPDSNELAFWNGAWTGAPQSADGTYPSERDIYLGSISTGLLSAASRLVLDLPKDAWIVDVAFAPDGANAALTIGLPSAGIGDPPSAYLQVVSLDGGKPRTIGGGVKPPPWDGPAVYGP
ncbi:MAG: zf-HC2 domain-containing protein [Candidatus Limnocylindria bacterium]